MGWWHEADTGLRMFLLFVSTWEVCLFVCFKLMEVIQQRGNTDDKEQRGEKCQNNTLEQGRRNEIQCTSSEVGLRQEHRQERS